MLSDGLRDFHKHGEYRPRRLYAGGASDFALRNAAIRIIAPTDPRVALPRNRSLSLPLVALPHKS
jgi:hypothetical protein